ncbi:MAG: chemotaxis protein CheW [Deltaproteobacteria bacterium]|nr:chemotaxis protein CheW [Deltaproteobacteria bacterium]
MKNVVVFTWGSERRALELRWVKEIITLGSVVRVPGGPAEIAGAINYHGRILPVLSPAVGDHQPRTGDPAIVVEIGKVTAAIATEGIGEVATLRTGPSGMLVDSAGRDVMTSSPTELVEAAVLAIASARKPGTAP